MLKILINAYAVNPNWGSEPGLGWNWVCNLAKYCDIYVITEGEWRTEIETVMEEALCKGIDASGKLTKKQAERLHFYYNPVSDKVRQICWNQGDWRFYWYYRKWQQSTLKIARQICTQNKIDLIHHLNMIGFREPGYLWKIENIPYVWGPIGGMDMIPINYLIGIPASLLIKSRIKNIISDFQRRHSPRVIKAMKKSDTVIAATISSYEFIKKYYKNNVILMGETGCSNKTVNNVWKRKSETFDLIWVGRFLYTKMLDLALQIMSNLNDYSNIHLHIYGNGQESDITRYHKLCDDLSLNNNVHWYGKVSNAEVQKKMNEADILLFTSIMEGTPHVVMEALGNNLPIICFDTCGQGNCVDDTCGIKIPLTNPEQSINDFSSAILELYHSPEKLSKLKQGCHSRQVELSWDKKVERMLKIYDDAIAHFKQTI